MQFDMSPSTSQGSCAHHAGKISSEAKLKLFIEPVPYAATSYLGTIGTMFKDSKVAFTCCAACDSRNTWLMTKKHDLLDPYVDT